MSSTNIIPNSAFAAVNHGNKIKIYFQGNNGHLLETYTDDGHNFYHTEDPLPAPSGLKIFTPIAAVSYHDGQEVRVYYLTPDFHIQELASSGNGWHTGLLNNLNLRAASYSHLAAVHYEEKFRIYYQRASDNKILEIVNDGPDWVYGATLREGIPGTKIAAIRTPDGHLRVYYQAPDFSTRQLTSKGDWSDDSEIASARTNPHNSFAIINVHPTGSDDTGLRLYIIKKDSNQICELSGGINAWRKVKTLESCTPQTNIAAVSWGQEIRVYTQAIGNDIRELRHGEEGGWRIGSTIPTA